MVAVGLQRLLECAEQAKEDAICAAVGNERRNVIRRIDAGEGTDRTLGKLNAKTPKLGAYSKSWGTKRVRRRRQVDRVDLKFTNDLRSDYSNTLIRGGEGCSTGVRRPENAKKIEYLSKQVGRAFNFNESEIENIRRVFRNEFVRRCELR